MPIQSQGFDTSSLYSAAPESRPVISLPSSPIQRSAGSFDSRTTSPSKQKRNKRASLHEDPTLVAARDARRKKEFYMLQRVWGLYPSSARPKTRREELQMLPSLCNDFESFEKQMEHLDRTVEDPGLLPQIRAVVRQRKEALRRQEEEAQMHKHWENISRTAQGIEEFKRTVSQWGDEVAETARLVHEYDQRAEQQIKRGYRTCQLIGECISETNEYIGALQEYSQQSAVYIQDARQYIDGVNSYAQECNQLAQRAHQVEAGAILTRYTSQKHRYEGRGSF